MTSALHAEGPRVDPGFVYPFLHAPVHAAVRMHPCMQGSIQRASIAQMVERKTLNLVVVGSSPTVGVLFFFAILNLSICRLFCKNNFVTELPLQ